MKHRRNGDSGSGEKRRELSSFFRIFKKWDVLVLIVLIVAVVFTVLGAVRGDGGEARVYIDGELKYSFSLATDGEYAILGGRMIIAVKDGKAYVASSDCAEQLCVHSSPVSAEGGMIVCLPNRVVIEIEGGEVDAVT